MNNKYIALCLFTAVIGAAFSALQIAIVTGSGTSYARSTSLQAFAVALAIVFTLLSSLVWLQGELHDYSGSHASWSAKRVAVGMLISAAANWATGILGSVLAPVIAAAGSFAYVYAVIQSHLKPRRSPRVLRHGAAPRSLLGSYIVLSAFTVLLAVVEVNNRQPGDHLMLHGFPLVFVCLPELAFSLFLSPLGVSVLDPYRHPALIAGFCSLNAAVWFIALSVRRRRLQRGPRGPS